MKDFWSFFWSYLTNIGICDNRKVIFIENNKVLEVIAKFLKHQIVVI